MKKIAQGAEAIIYRDNSRVIKDRIKKNYRISEIDTKLRRTRTNAEARLIKRAEKAGLLVPKVIKKEKNKLTLEFIDGKKLRDYLASSKDVKIMKLLGELVSKMHKANIIHGDLTTSNLIKKEAEIYFIDFGLSQYSEKIEDKAVDLHVFKECLKSKHFEIYEKAWNIFKEAYSLEDVLKRLKKVESRGRYKH